MKKRSWTFYSLILCLVLVSACQSRINAGLNPTTALTEASVVEPSVSTSTPEINDPLPTNEATAEPTSLVNAAATDQSWKGLIESLPAGSQFNDQFRSSSLNHGTCGIDGDSDELNKLITQYRDSGSVVSIQGIITLDIPDVNGCQIRVTSLTLE